ncbi:hypothetical protein, partial [Pseudorhodobacter sp.]|uniref:hypothetical protein n=1 Tax=Pseudorhodobacter sp. TaxID=1934400 RepID=UPI0026496EC8
FSQIIWRPDCPFSRTDLGKALHDDLSVKGKAEFALDLLDVKDQKKIQPPEYLKEGLLWLSTQLKKHQQDLGVAPFLAPPNPKQGQDA